MLVESAECLAQQSRGFGCMHKKRFRFAVDLNPAQASAELLEGTGSMDFVRTGDEKLTSVENL